MIDFLRRYYNCYLRRLDTQNIWPAICVHTTSVGEARIAMLAHVAIDPAWADLTSQEASDIVCDLKYIPHE